jgi:hypothetical protein
MAKSSIRDLGYHRRLGSLLVAQHLVAWLTTALQGDTPERLSPKGIVFTPPNHLSQERTIG